MNEADIKVAVVGCGGIGGRHCEAYKRISNVALAAFVDSDIAKAKEFSRIHGGQATYSSVNEIIPGSVDLISITTPPMYHTQPVLDALGMGAHVFCEKPITMDIGESRQIEELSREKGFPLGIGFKMRFEPIFVKAREMIGEIGDILAVSTIKIQPYHQRKTFDWVPQVGAMYELSVHEYDLINFIGGLKPMKVYGQLEFAPGWTREKRAFLQVAYDGGVTGQSMSVYSEDASFHYRDLTMTFVGTRGYMRVERPDRIVLHTDDYRIVPVESEDGLNAFVAELSSYIKGMATGSIHPCAGLEDALMATALVESANESHRTGRWVDINTIE